MPAKLPVRIYDLVTFDRKWLEGKTIEYYLDLNDNVWKPRVTETHTGKEVWPVQDGK